jgi:AcrR family transcriptional regulator
MQKPANQADFRRDQILEAAAGVFLRYGCARTTMNDIASAVGCSRTLLYVSFANKEEVFEAMVLRASAQAFAEIRKALPSIGSLEARLLFVCEEWMAKRYDLLKAYPDAKDLFDLSFSAVKKMYLEFQDLLFELLNEAKPSAALNCTTRELALCITYALRGFKEMAFDSDEFRRLIRIQVRLVACAVGRPEQRRAPQRKGFRRGDPSLIKRTARDSRESSA